MPQDFKQLKIITLDEAESSNDLLLDKNITEPTLIWVKNQTKGRGQRGKKWHSPSLALTFSIAFISDRSTHLSAWPLICALAIVETLKNHSKQTILIKWPNDLYVQKSSEFYKIAGVLTETQIRNTVKVVTGIGINLDTPKITNTSYSTSFLETQTSQNELINAIGCKLYLAWQSFINENSIDPQLFKQYDLLYNQPISAYEVSTNNTITGVAKGVTNQGELRIEQNKQIVSYHNLKNITINK